ncbi:MBL fold metallo-hydrolase [Streptomyces niveiscabiei]|uniref:MBL fold metallo-hydrolase n=1 Tax=Streptomyces niveiscabiei TaxID=164115 RepID=UPI0029B62010|nr:MBL fold metallo-hydrolase [Streptomyces niveiscabiei]MDX3384157.1 MBL fold metallo-hydrolase [Streptomyces niveiscabiei]
MTVTWEELGWERLGDGVGRVRLPGWDCTVGLVITPDAALLIDSGSSLPEGARLRDLLPVNVTHLALTHPHFDHVFGAAAFPEAEVYAAYAGYDAAELAADAVRNGLDTDLAQEAAAALTAPGHVVTRACTPVPGIDLVPLGPAHTPYDLVVTVSGAVPVVFCGDLVEESGEPQAGPDAAVSRWPSALDALLALGGEDAVYVPGHGAVVDAAFVRRQRDALSERFGVSRG